MSNCLFEAAFEQILKDCKCAPGFHNEGGADAMEVSASEDPDKLLFYFIILFIFNIPWQVFQLYFQTYEVCTGAQLACSNEILNRMGQFNQGTVIDI